MLVTAFAVFAQFHITELFARVQYHLCERYLWALAVSIGKLHEGFILF
jgi:hypothetical protein